jgi:hypothetical protein
MGALNIYYLNSKNAVNKMKKYNRDSKGRFCKVHANPFAKESNLDSLLIIGLAILTFSTFFNLAV